LLVLVAPGTADARQTPRSYVSLGDSYTAGPVIPVQQTDPLGCLRSDHNYPHLVAAALGVSVFRDPSCSGAETGDMTQPQGVSPGPNPPQFDKLDADTQLVTLGIGGNDIGFSEILKNCFSPTPTGHPCQDHFVVNGHDELAARIQETAPKVAAVLDGIHQRSPKARVFVVAYLAILPETGSGCWPQMPIAPDDVPYLRGIEKQLNGMLAAEAKTNRASYVDAYTASIGHDACQLPTTRWVEPVVPTTPAAPVHPNLFGMQGYAAAVLAAVNGSH
jgi:lysophospholipase L1-like esterase